jgi:WD40 repeat protein
MSVMSPSSRPESPDDFDTAIVRELLMTALSSQELEQFCFDHFNPVHREFTPEMNEGLRVQFLMKYCADQGLMETLVMRLQQANPNQYTRFEDRLRKTEYTSNAHNTDKIPFMVPFLRNQNFVGRESDLERLHVALHGNTPVGIRPAGLTGMGGIGKTQLAVEYAYRYRDIYVGGVFCLSPAEPLGQAFAQIGKGLYPDVAESSLDEQIRAAAGYLRVHPNTLVILDGLSDPTTLNVPASSDLIPAGLPCRLLFTTRRRDLGTFFLPIEVAVLPEEAALHLLLHHPARQAVLDPSHPEHAAARAICEILGYLPLALEIAGTHLGQQVRTPLTTYCQELLDRGALPVLDDRRGKMHPENLGTRHTTAVAATLQGQWDALQSENARMLLRVAGQLPEAALIPAARLGLLAAVSDRQEGFFASPMTAMLLELQDASLVEELQEDQVRLHPLVRDFAARQTPTTEVRGFRHRCAAHLAAAYQDFATLEDHCARRGVDALQEDLIMGLELISVDSSHASLPPSDATSLKLEAGLTEARDEHTKVKSSLWPIFSALRHRSHRFCKRTGELDEENVDGSCGIEGELRSLLRVLQCEAHNLRHWDPMRCRAFFAQQIYKRAIDLGLTSLADQSRTSLSQVANASWLTILAATRESPALERTLSGHEHAAYAVALTPDGRQVVSASADRTLKVWNLTTGREERTLSGHANRVYAVAVTPDGQHVISASADGTLKVWSLATGREERTLIGHTDWVMAVAVTPDGRRAVSASADSTLKIWNLSTGNEECTLSGHASWVRAVAITPDGRRAVSASDDFLLKVWDLATGREEGTMRGHDHAVYAVAITYDGRRMVSGSADGDLKVWNLVTGREERALSGHEHAVYAVTITPDGCRAMSTSEDRTIKLWDLLTGQEKCTLSGHENSVYAIAVTRGGQQVISASEDRTLKVWNLTAEREGSSASGHKYAVYAVAISPDGRRAISACADGTLKIWNLVDGREERTLIGHEYAVYAVIVTPDGRHAVSASEDRTLKVWNLATGREKHTLSGHMNWVNAVAVTPDGQRVVSASADGTLKVWNLGTGRETLTLHGHTASVQAVVITAEGQRAISASADRTLGVWNTSIAADRDPTLGYREHTLTGHTDGVFVLDVTSDGRRAVSGSTDRTVRVWDVAAGREEYTFTGHTGGVYAVAITPDGRRAVTASEDRTLRTWDLTAGREEYVLSGHTGGVYAVAITPDGRRAVSASEDRTLKVWNLATGREVATIALEGALNCVAITPGGTVIVAGDEAGNVYCLQFHEKATREGESVRHASA